jgi:hypothetical protein
MRYSKEFVKWARAHDAMPIDSLAAAKDAPADKRVAIETRNFGWILSPIDPVTGKRKILKQE